MSDGMGDGMSDGMSDKENNEKDSTDTETILMALDQISQTIDVMTSVVGRLRTYLLEQESIRESETSAEQLLSQAEASSTVH
jgi:hypothetical protein